MPRLSAGETSDCVGAPQSRAGIEGFEAVTAFEFQQARAYLGMTQVQLAEAIGVNDRTIRYYETGRVPVGRSRVATIRLLIEKKEREGV
jgi:DNA-binding transcriptional regulator YiaG